MMRGVCILIIGLFLSSSFTLALANTEKEPKGEIAESMKEILSAINEIIKTSIKLAEAKLKELQGELEERGSSIDKEVEKSIMEALQRILAELRRLEQALKEHMAERGGVTKERLDQYMKDRDKLEERVGQLRKRIRDHADEIGKEYRSLKGPVREKIQDILKEMEMAIDRMSERLERQRQIDETIYI